jgi:hypothetical protein
LKGLEANDALFSCLERTKRFDSEYFNPNGVRAVQVLTGLGAVALNSVVGVSDGNHFSISDEFCDEGIPYFRGQDVVANFFMEQATPNLIPESAFDLPHMRRSHLLKGDVLLSIVGTIGESALYTSDAPATCSCKLAILRPNEISAEYLAVFLKTNFGSSQIVRLTRGAIQGSLLLEDMDQVLIPRFSDKFEMEVSRLVLEAQRCLDQASEQILQAENRLIDSMGLGEAPPEPLTYTASASQALSAARIDAEYFAPRVAQLLARLSADGLTIEDVAPARHDGFDSAKHAPDTFCYIEIGGLRADGTATSEELPTDEAPSRASQLVRANDILTSTVRPIRRLSAIITPDQDGQVCSSGFVVLEPKDVAPEVLLTYLRLPVICELMDLHTSASLYPAISERDLLKLPIPRIPGEAAEQIVASIRAAHTARHQATSLLDRAKRAVELAIEQGEAAGMAHLQQ